MTAMQITIQKTNETAPLAAANAAAIALAAAAQQPQLYFQLTATGMTKKPAGTKIYQNRSFDVKRRPHIKILKYELSNTSFLTNFLYKAFTQTHANIEI